MSGWDFNFLDRHVSGPKGPVAIAKHHGLRTDLETHRAGAQRANSLGGEFLAARLRWERRYWAGS